ncbi:MAG: hypothetical protein OEZ01_10415, partial [Candidatus Heimdallarchaeota archaeon]|nr:hypothetical protein [Candidatus Heimdallarchaeota archaeon]
MELETEEIRSLMNYLKRMSTYEDRIKYRLKIVNGYMFAIFIFIAGIIDFFVSKINRDLVGFPWLGIFFIYLITNKLLSREYQFLNKAFESEKMKGLDSFAQKAIIIMAGIIMGMSMFYTLTDNMGLHFPTIAFVVAITNLIIIKNNKKNGLPEVFEDWYLEKWVRVQYIPNIFLISTACINLFLYYVIDPTMINYHGIILGTFLFIGMLI